MVAEDAGTLSAITHLAAGGIARPKINGPAERSEHVLPSCAGGGDTGSVAGSREKEQRAAAAGSALRGSSR